MQLILSAMPQLHKHPYDSDSKNAGGLPCCFFGQHRISSLKRIPHLPHPQTHQRDRQYTGEKTYKKRCCLLSRRNQWCTAMYCTGNRQINRHGVNRKLRHAFSPHVNSFQSARGLSKQQSTYFSLGSRHGRGGGDQHDQYRQI